MALNMQEKNHSSYRQTTSSHSKSESVRKSVLSTLIYITAGALFLGALVYGVNKGNVPADTKTISYTVQSGDTVWGIVSRFDTRDNTNAAVQWVDKHNKIHGTLQPGQVISIPIGR
ncbi:LysM peptidoglycan-binding domain-containing protein [Alicyclobacillus fastidiosus]|uniref:LysM peptidoglycan-binding domain-containing protein n=1 Tax=Alicyclobacillus fastidiosus TaxID=392011 RepID=A0ABV5ALZ3_9BACL|nr:LysM peptidoglycan-binding domain-containing protein [Alicyclobacillus fastidiosus]WEH09304.1 LysM peptidoglycan-binding domain-containing protein [Alicyclobacillus fastidiosus]